MKASRVVVPLLGWIASVLAVPAVAQEKPEAGPRPTPAASPHFWDAIPPSPSTRMAPELRDAYWHGQFQRVNREVLQADKTELVFFGDSITLGWLGGAASGQAVWKQHFSRYAPVNMGNSGDITPVMLYRVTHGNLAFAEGRHPKVAVLLCGINNFIVTLSAGGKERWELGVTCPPADIANGRRAIAQVFRRRLPRTRVILMALLPVADPVKWAKCREVNALDAALVRNENEVLFLDLQDTFLSPDGSIQKQLYSDGTHLTPEGYAAWAEGIEPAISTLMKAPPLEPVKIMLIGGSVTEGLDSSAAYRRYLDGLLRKEGHLFDFVGSRKKHNDDAAEPDSYEYDVDHEGHWGRGSAWLAENLARLLESNVPDVAVLHVGTEDIHSSKAEAGPVTDRIVQGIDTMIHALRSRNRNVKIVLSKIIPAGAQKEAVDLLNQKISSYAHSRSTPRQPLLVADLPEGFDVSSDVTPGGSLPSATGARKMAKVVADAIGSMLRNTER